jgi:LmbE family N-acetylglucosaminyl deacetylase
MLAPHPDDFDAVGITMRCFRDNGNEIHLGVMSSSASGVEDDYDGPPPENGSFSGPLTNEAKSRIREREQKSSCHFFGLPDSHLTFLRLEEDNAGQPLENRDNFHRMKSYFDQVHAELIFLPHGNDTNTGHRRTWSMFRKIASEADHCVTGFYNRDPKTIAMRSDIYTVFNQRDAGWKRELLLFHQSQHHRNLKCRAHGFDDRIIDLNRRTGLEELQEDVFAEVFECEFWARASA